MSAGSGVTGRTSKGQTPYSPRPLTCSAPQPMPLLDLENIQRRLQTFLSVCQASSVLAVTYRAENLAHQASLPSIVYCLQSDFRPPP
jgi:hypothetical protein